MAEEVEACKEELGAFQCAVEIVIAQRDAHIARLRKLEDLQRRLKAHEDDGK
jgi:hypothetical protein